MPAGATMESGRGRGRGRGRVPGQHRRHLISCVPTFVHASHRLPAWLKTLIAARHDIFYADPQLIGVAGGRGRGVAICVAFALATAHMPHPAPMGAQWVNKLCPCPAQAMLLQGVRSLHWAKRSTAYAAMLNYWNIRLKLCLHFI